MKSKLYMFALASMLCGTVHADQYRCLPCGTNFDTVDESTCKLYDIPYGDDYMPLDVPNRAFSVEWEQKCGCTSPSGVNEHMIELEVHGIAFCTQDPGGSPQTELPGPQIELNSVASTQTLYTNDGGSAEVGVPQDGGDHTCYCKMTWPFTSEWIYADEMGEGCRAGCAATCANKFAEDFDFRNALAQNIDAEYDSGHFDSNIMTEITPTEYIDWDSGGIDLGNPEYSWKTDGADNYIPDRCPDGSGVMAIKTLSLASDCNEIGAVNVGWTPSCLATKGYDYDGSPYSMEEWVSKQDCSMYAPRGIAGFDGTGDYVMYGDVCPLSFYPPD